MNEYCRYKGLKIVGLKWAKWLFMLVILFSRSSSAFRWPTYPNTSFSVGEQLIYDVGWKSAKAGQVTLHVAEKGVRKNRPAYKFVLEAQTNTALDAVFKVRDRYESWTDVQSFCSLGFAKRIQEGKVMKLQDYFLDPPSGSFKGRVVRPNKSSLAQTIQGSMPACVQDAVSAIYYLRGQNLSVGQVVPLQVMDGSNMHFLQIAVRRKEPLKTVLGYGDCLVIEPLFKNEQGQYQPHPEASILVWLTDDKKHIPVQVSATLGFGHIQATLKSSAGLDI